MKYYPSKWYFRPHRAINPKEWVAYLPPKKPKTIRLSRGEWSQLISWQARPEDIVIAKLDRRCPKCDATTRPTRVKFHGNGEPFVIRGDFDIGKENGRVFGARCKWCGWSF